MVSPVVSVSTRARRVHDAREQMLDAAEQLVALHGQDGASSRAITLAAGQRHNSAIAYHFGDRQGLMNAVWLRGSDAVDTLRRASTSTIGAASPTLGQLVDIYIEPLAAYLGSRTPSYWARFNEEALKQYPLIIPADLRTTLAGDETQVPLNRLLNVFEEMQLLTCHGAHPASPLRVSALIRTVISTFAAWERDTESGRATITAEAVGRHLRISGLAFLQADAN